MKHVYTLILSSIVTSFAFGQGYTISPSDSVHQDISVGGYYTSTIDLPHDNLTSDTVVLGWEVLSIDVPAGGNWDYSYCDYTACHDGTTTDAIMTPIMQGQSAFLRVNLSAPVIGFGMFKIKVFNINNPSDFDVLTFTFNATLGLSDIELGQQVKMFPNPMTDDKLTVTGILSGSTLTVTNTLGQTVLSQRLNASAEKYTLTNAELRRGVYFVQLSRNGESYCTRKLIVK